MAVDGSLRLDNVYRLEPGVHRLILASRHSLKDLPVAREQVIEFKVEPCKHYYLAAAA